MRRSSVRVLLPTEGKDLSFHLVGTRESLPEALDLGSAVLPVLARSYWRQALAALVVLLLLRRMLRRS